jgi:hypothetical protein
VDDEHDTALNEGVASLLTGPRAGLRRLIDIEFCTHDPELLVKMIG